MSVENRLIWDQVCVSDPMQLRSVDFGRKFLSIDAYPQIHKATLIFGPMGIGFGLEDVEERIVETVKGTKKDPNAPCQYLLVKSVFWYRFPGTTVYGKIPLINGIEFNASNDPGKKVVTNTISKALSYLGFNYDVFKGSWDDDPYADRPDTPAPDWMLVNFKRLIESDAFNEATIQKVTQFQIDAGWTMKSVQNFINDAKKRIVSKGLEVPELLTGGEEDGISSTGADRENEETEGKKTPQGEGRA